MSTTPSNLSPRERDFVRHQVVILKAGLMTLMEQCDAALMLLDSDMMTVDESSVREEEEALAKVSSGLPTFQRRGKAPDDLPTSSQQTE